MAAHQYFIMVRQNNAKVFHQKADKVYMKQLVTREQMHHYCQEAGNYVSNPVTCVIPLIINGYDHVMGTRVGASLMFRQTGFGVTTKVEQKTDKGYIQLTLGERIGYGPNGSTFMIKEWESSGTVNLGSALPVPDWAKQYIHPSVGYPMAPVGIGTTGIAITPPERTPYQRISSEVTVSGGCPHQWEQKPLFTGHYHKCLMCGEEKQ